MVVTRDRDRDVIEDEDWEERQNMARSLQLFDSRRESTASLAARAPQRGQPLLGHYAKEWDRSDRELVRPTSDVAQPLHPSPLSVFIAAQQYRHTTANPLDIKHVLAHSIMISSGQ